MVPLSLSLLHLLSLGWPPQAQSAVRLSSLEPRARGQLSPQRFMVYLESLLESMNSRYKEKNNMNTIMNTITYIGVDVSKQYLDLYHPTQRHQQVKNDALSLISKIITEFRVFNN